MNDYFVYDNDSIAPSYIPGIVGYGQQGSPGNTGDLGASVYYSSYDLSYTDNNKNEEVIDLIKQGKALSNNYHYNEDVSYKENDIIIDATCNFYRITKNLSYESFETKNLVLSDITTNITSFTISCITSFLNNTNYPDEIKNDSYDSSITSYKYIHNDTNTETINGNYVKFSLLFKNNFDVSKYTYKFVLILPNGKPIELDSSNNVETIFVDNKLLFGNFDMLTWNDTSEITLNEILEVSDDISDLSLDIDNNNDTTLYSLLKELNESTDDNIKNELNKKISIITSYLIKNNCFGYAEMISKSTGISYRINLYDTFIDNTSNDSSLKEDNKHSGHIIENTANVKWKAVLNEYKQGEFLMNKDGTLFNPFISYAMFETSDKNNKLSETGLSEQFYFVDAGGFSHYFMNTIRACDMNDYDHPQNSLFINNYFMQYNQRINNIIKKNNSDYIFKVSGKYIADRNRTYKILLKNTKKVSLNILYTNYSSYEGLKYDDNDSSTTYRVNYPNSLVYVGVPDSSLINYDSSDGYIKYSSKFVPPGYNVDDKTTTIADAGMANVILDLENYELSDSSVHTIEIGVTLLDDISLKHSYDSSNYVIFDDDNNIKLINSKHRPTSLGQRYYHFNNGDYFKITNLNAPFGTNDKAIDKELEQCSGIPDIKIYVTSLEEGTPVSNTDSSMLETLIHKDTPKE